MASAVADTRSAPSVCVTGCLAPSTGWADTRDTPMLIYGGGQAAKLTTTFLKRHAEKHEKLPSQQLAEAAPLNAGRAESWVRRGVLKNIAAIKNINQCTCLVFEI